MNDLDSGRTPLVTVVIATYNRSAILPYALRSLQQQTLGDWEAWIVGDGCTDDTEAVIHAMHEPRFHWLNLATNSGSQSTPNAAGLRQARGRYVAYLGHDDLWFPWHLEALTTAIADADVAHGLLALVGPDGAEQARGARVVSERQHIPPSCWMHRRDVVAEVGGWRDATTLSLPVDADVMNRLVAAGKHIVLSPRLSVLKFKSATWRMYALEGGYPQPPFLAAMKEDAHALHDRVLTDLALAYARLQDQPEPSTNELRAALGRLGYGFAHRYRHRPFVESLLRWRFQRYRRQLRQKRGLSGSKQ